MAAPTQIRLNPNAAIQADANPARFFAFLVIAGLLNILAIYDAFEGPAYQGLEEDSDARAESSSLTSGELKAEVVS